MPKVRSAREMAPSAMIVLCILVSGFTCTRLGRRHHVSCGANLRSHVLCGNMQRTARFQEKMATQRHDSQSKVSGLVHLRSYLTFRTKDRLSIARVSGEL
ncbi:uncharacterized protein J3R85_018088 [Psidium guajava]|nr:uncharacterized protein J3R85_018088 [Psidium guajava]